MSTGKSVRLFLADGSPGGLLTAEIMNWTGHVVGAPRSELPALLTRSEAARTGVYLLIGDDPDTVGGTVAYIGEGDDVGKRLASHAKPEEQGGKDFWARAILLTSKDSNLTKAHARYLESRFIEIASKAKRAKLMNLTNPPPIQLPEADRSDMEYFIEQAKIVLPVLGINILRSLATAVAVLPMSTPNPTTVEPSVAVAESPPSPMFEIRPKKGGFVAMAREVDGEFVVLANSQARASWIGVESGYKALREQLEQDGVIPTTNDGMRTFLDDHVFDSPSAAAAVVLGRSANGRNEWKVVGSGVPYGAWQNLGIEQAASSDGR